MNHRAIARLFNRTFRQFDVLMTGGAPEPLYTPGAPARIRYTRDYATSALHEAAHWCIAGRRRRALDDYGYVYAPPPRNPRQRREFESVELRAQAVEAAFCQAAGIAFRASADDLESAESDRLRFEQRVLDQLRVMRDSGLPPRAERFRAVLEAACRNG